MAFLDELQGSSGGADNDVRGLDSLEESDVLLDGHTAINHLCANVREVLGEANELLLDLVGEFSVVAENEC